MFNVTDLRGLLNEEEAQIEGGMALHTSLYPYITSSADHAFDTIMTPKATVKSRGGEESNGLHQLSLSNHLARLFAQAKHKSDKSHTPLNSNHRNISNHFSIARQVHWPFPVPWLPRLNLGDPAPRPPNIWYEY